MTELRISWPECQPVNHYTTEPHYDMFLASSVLVTIQ